MTTCIWYLSPQDMRSLEQMHEVMIVRPTALAESPEHSYNVFAVIELTPGMKPKGAQPSKAGRHVDYNWDALSRRGLTWC